MDCLLCLCALEISELIEFYGIGCRSDLSKSFHAPLARPKHQFWIALLCLLQVY